MLKAEPSPVRGRLPGHMFGEFLLAVLLLAAVGFTPHDAVSAAPDSLLGPNVHFHVAVAQQPTFGLTLPGLGNLSGSAAASGVVISSNAL
ncbi:MAG TPA: hypothetical protein VGE99_02945, partial [Candidatus Dormibacteraeota bacterium]